MADDNTIKIIRNQRSSIESSKHDVAAMVESCLRLAGAEVIHGTGTEIFKRIIGKAQEVYRK